MLFRSQSVDADALDPALVTDWAQAWHRLDPWPDAVAGLARLRALAPVVTLSNGNVALMIELSRRAGLEWDAILGAEHARAFKPSAEVYLSTAAACGVQPGDFCLVAAHHSDLAAARKELMRKRRTGARYR